MNIGMIISTPFPPEEGIGFYVYNLSKNLIEKGHEISVFTRGNSLKTENFSLNNINVYKIPFLPTYPFHVQVHKYYLEKNLEGIPTKFDLFHIHSPLSPPIKTDIPIISTIHTSLIEDMKHFQVNNLKSLAIKLTTNVSGHPLTQKLIDRSKYVTTVSSAVANELQEYYDINNPLVLGNGVNQNIFIPNNSENQKQYVLFVGRLDYRKGIIELINASKLLKKEKIEILVAGEGPLKSLLEKEISKNNLNNLTLLGQVTHEKLIKLYQDAAMFIFPSHYEGLPTVLLEAMSCACPVVVSNIPAHQDIIKDNENGLFVEKGSAEYLAEKIKYLRDDSSKRIDLGIKARKTIEDNYTWDIITKKYEDLYKSMI